MLSIRDVIRLAVLVGFLLVPASLRAQLTILPLGDSITYGTDEQAPGGSYPGGYRGILYSDLVAQGKSVTYVGAQDGNPSLLLTSAGEEANDGFAGYKISDLTGNLVGSVTPMVNATAVNPVSNLGGNWLSLEGPAKPNVILLMAGTNDIAQNYDPADPVHPYEPNVYPSQFTADMTTRMGTLISLLLDEEPQATILVGGIMPFYLFGAVQSYDQDLQAMISTQFAQDNVKYVDFYDPFNSTTSPGSLASQYDSGDDIHPNAAGYAEMASIWDAAIINDVSAVPEPSTNALFVIGGILLFGWRGFRRYRERVKPTVT